MDYSGINLPENVIIIENKNGQGYVVPEGSSLDNARYWAKRSDWEPKEYKYKNGTFTLRVTNAAGYSSQGGKLSFWNCQIRTEDEKEFLIGIASDCLAELIINNTLINGKCQNKIYFAKCGNSTWAITENMPSYKVALEDKKIKETKTTSKYKPGDLVSSLTSTDVYLGEVYEYVATYRTSSWLRRIEVGNRAYDRLVVINSAPKKYYWYARVYEDEKNSIDLDGRQISFYVGNLLRSKSSRRVLKSDFVSKEFLVDRLTKAIKHHTDCLKSTNYPTYCYLESQGIHSYSLDKSLRMPIKEKVVDALMSITSDYSYYVAYESDLPQDILEAIKTGDLERNCC